MKACNLFPGAIVLFRGHMVTIKTIEDQVVTIEGPNGGLVSEDSLEGIPLTLKILVRILGATAGVDEADPSVYRLEGYRPVDVWSHLGGDFSLYRYETPCVFHHVHELQRLAHGLTGKPLEVSIPEPPGTIAVGTTKEE